MPPKSIQIEITNNDALTFGADVLALKYAQMLHGVDAAAYRKLTAGGTAIALPKEGDLVLHESHGFVAARAVSFTGVQPLLSFGYREIRDFARKTLIHLSRKAPDLEHLALTVHGANYGLDETEAFLAEVAGLADAAMSGLCPRGLEHISIVELDSGRSVRLAGLLSAVAPGGILPAHPAPHDETASTRGLRAARVSLQEAGHLSAEKSHVFVAMPFAKEMDDIFHYGIQGAVNSAGLLCERADLAAFTGDVMSRVRERIETSSLVIAEITGANPNVYLEVGYAWGRNVRTVFLIKEGFAPEFDVRGHRHIAYASIKHLEDSLTQELLALKRTTRNAD